MLGRSGHDREILRLALPALGALAAEPLYLLVDTAIVGHLGTPELAALAIAGTLLTGAFTLCNFLAYATTARVARMHGAGDAAAGRLAAQAMWLALAIGAVLSATFLVIAEPAVALMGGEGRTATMAVNFLRISSLGIPFAIVALAGQGFLRGVSDLRTPLLILVAANALNVVLEVWFVYGLDWGLTGSAWGTVVAQSAMGAAFVWSLLRFPADDRRPRLSALRPLLGIGRQIFVRTAALYGAFALASAVAARFGDASLAAHLIAFQVFGFLALVLDSVAIAGQVIVGRRLGGGDPAGARAAARRMIGWSTACGCLFGLVLLAVAEVLPRVFSPDPAVLERAAVLWPLFALTQPVGGAVFALDGILIGAGDTRFLMRWMLVAAIGVGAPLGLLALALDWGVVGVWVALNGFLVARLVSLGVRFSGERWAVTGAPA
ncbi:MAG: MATE family efflux transporter [Thermoleophilaceae bacterium]